MTDTMIIIAFAVVSPVGWIAILGLRFVIGVWLFGGVKQVKE